MQTKKIQNKKMISEDGFMQESMDLKRLALCLKKQLWIMILTALCGGVLCSGIYLLVRSLLMKPEWEAKSQFYMEFIYDPSGQVLQSYNGYTWNDLLHGDPVIDRITEVLLDSEAAAGMLVSPESNDEGEGGFPEEAMSREERMTWYQEAVREAIKGEILSDHRLLTVTTTAGGSEWTAMLQSAIEEGILRYAQGQKEIVSMEKIRSIEPALVIWDDRTMQAAIGGGILFLAVALFGWWFYYILDDSLYVIADSEKRYPFPVLGLLVRNERDENHQPYGAELAENAAYLLKDQNQLIFLSVESGFWEENGPSDTGEALRAKKIFDQVMKERAAGQRWVTDILPSGEGGEALRNADGIIIVVPFGKRNGKKIDRTISFLRNQDCRIQGILISEGNERFWCHYYGRQEV